MKHTVLYDADVVAKSHVSDCRGSPTMGRAKSREFYFLRKKAGKQTLKPAAPNAPGAPRHRAWYPKTRVCLVGDARNRVYAETKVTRGIRRLQLVIIRK